jgi:serine/threonine protein kinase
LNCSRCGAALSPGNAACPKCDATTHELPTPLPRIEGYTFIRLLGSGGMGTVYLAEDVALGRPVAVKLITEDAAQTAEARARLRREARAMATVEHPNIVRVYAFGEAEGLSYVVMEYVEGTVLSDKIRGEGALTYVESLTIVRQIVEALEAAWEKRIVHRDIKPSNILLDRRGRARVADFGLAKPLPLLQQGAPLTLTERDSVMGTPQYLSPERAQGLPEDFRADVYSLGVVFYEMLTGTQPFHGSTSYAIASKHLHEEFPPLRGKRADLPRGAQELLDWMTRKSPEARPASHAQLLERIDTLLKSPMTPASQLDLLAAEGGPDAIPDSMVPSWELELPPELPAPRLEVPLRAPGFPAVTPRPASPTPRPTARPTPVAPPTPPPARSVAPPAMPRSEELAAAPATPRPAAEPLTPAPPTQAPQAVSIDCTGCGRRHSVPLNRYPEAGGRFPCPKCQTPIQFPPKSHWTEKARPTSGATPLPAPTPKPAQDSVAAPSPVKPPSLSSPPVLSTRRETSGSRGHPGPKRGIVIAAAGAAALALALVLFLVFRSPGERQPSPAPSLPSAAASSAGASAPAAPPPETTPAAAPASAASVLDSQSFRDYTARILRSDASSGETFEVLRGGQPLLSLQGVHFMIGAEDGRGKPDPATEMGREVTGESTANLVVSEWTGKSKCCVTYRVYDLGTSLREIATLPTDNTKSFFKDLDGDGRLEFVTTDGTFAGWRGIPASAPRPQVIFRFEDGRYRLSLTLMQKEPPEEAQMQAMKDRVRKSPSWRQGKEPPELAREMIDLIYSGQAYVAWRFCSEAWPPNVPGRSQFLEEFRSRLDGSPYGAAVKAMNTNINNG